MITVSGEQYYNTGIIIDYQLQIPLHFDSTVKPSPVNITTIFLHMVSFLSHKPTINSLNLLEQLLGLG